MESFPEIIAAAMRSEWGSSPSARKQVGLLTCANERAVRNWFEGRNGPSGANLVALIKHSDAVFEAVLALSARRQNLPLIQIDKLRVQLLATLTLIDETSAQPTIPDNR